MSKKFTALFLAFIMVLGALTPAFAAEEKVSAYLVAMTHDGQFYDNSKIEILAADQDNPAQAVKITNFQLSRISATTIDNKEYTNLPVINLDAATNKYYWVKADGKFLQPVQMVNAQITESKAIHFTGKVENTPVVFKEVLNSHKLNVQMEVPQVNGTPLAFGIKIDGIEKTLNKDISLTEGKHTITFSIPQDVRKNIEIVQKYTNINPNLSRGQNEYTIDLKKDEQVSFIVVDKDLQIKVDPIVIGDSRVNGSLDKNLAQASVTAYYKEKDYQVSKTAPVESSGKYSIKDLKEFNTVGEEISLFLKDTAGYYSQLLTEKVQKIAVPFKLDPVTENQTLVRGEFTEKNYPYKPDFTLVKIDEKGQALPNEKPMVFKAVKAAGEKDVYLYKIEKDKDGVVRFTLDNLVNFKVGERYRLTAKVNENTESFVDFQVANIDKAQRISGKDRLQTALEIARETYPKTETVILANGFVSADALAAGPLANALDAPILLTDAHTRPEGMDAYLTSAGVKNIVVVGGNSSVSEKALSGFSQLKIERIAGENRYDTAVKVAQELIKSHGYDAKSIILANGLDGREADALAVGPYAVQNKKPIILVNGTVMENSVKNMIKAYHINKAVIVGGDQSVRDALAKNNGLEIEIRLSGKDRYETALAVAKHLKGMESVILANGYASADALSSISLAKAKKAAILLVEDPINDYVNYPTLNYIKDQKIRKIFLAGGKSSIGSLTETYINDTLLKQVEKTEK